LGDVLGSLLINVPQIFSPLTGAGERKILGILHSFQENREQF